MSEVDFSGKIPNNVGLKDDRRLTRALEKWLPAYKEWWGQMGPEGFSTDEVYLRTAVDVGSEGWAHFDHVKMPDYRWGIFLADAEPDRKIGFGDEYGKPVWQSLPGEHRNALQRIIVNQADTEPASVEQQRLLGQTAPSLYDLRNLFQVNVEEGRHLWAMVYLLHAHFGRDGREQAEQLLQRSSGSQDKPRILSTFNDPIQDWLSFFMFTTFTDRDGKYQLLALAQSSFDPLSRTCHFMLVEEAHHLTVGQLGVARVVERTAEIMKSGIREPDRVREQGVIDLATIQRYVNQWYSSSLDLFGGEESSNAATFFAAGLKGRFDEPRQEDHRAVDGEYELEKPDNEGNLSTQTLPVRSAMNELLRDGYVANCNAVVTQWNRVLESAGLEERLTLPSRRFNRGAQSIYAKHKYDLEGNLITSQAFEANRARWLPSAQDLAFVQSLMSQVLEPGKIAGWIAPPKKGINGMPFNWEYVRTPK